MILEDLRKRIYPLHQELEKTPLLAKLSGKEIDPDFSIHDFCLTLQKFYGFHAPLEKKLLPEVLQKYPELSSFFFPKLDQLESDLQKLCKCELPKLAVFSGPPLFDSAPGWLGLLYSLEGSCMGRAFLWPKIQSKLSLKDEDSLFFSAARKSGAADWKNFCKRMEDFIQCDAQKEELISGAVETFKKLHQWFSE